ncbi:MAG TPA: GDCCVxC domain-containing (seleno)protein [Gemmatimonadaceae bacterium]|nr:GDCCVxC domain-containing (seleno)protein [Gemmatimonadaceae bacterium]
MELETDLTCPACSHVERLTMPTDACVFFHECVACHTRLRPNAGDCCVFCSFGSVPCPPIQAGGSDCCSADQSAIANRREAAK